MSILTNFKISRELEDYESVIEGISKGITFKHTNLWILIFAILIASLGLNVNSTAVIIGAMLISPLMGPIMGIGLSLGIYDLHLLKRSYRNLLFATVVGLLTSTIFFSISPTSEVRSELLARTSPNVYDVLIALFGGFSGIIANSSKQKGNVIPGVAIATALMPPLCTAGFGLATGNISFFLGALYLYMINTVFIGIATLVTVRYLHFPLKQLPEAQDETKTRRIVWLVAIVTLLPSIYFAYDIIKKNRFESKANEFIAKEAKFPNDYLLNKNINSASQKIVLTFGGRKIEQNEIDEVKSKMSYYGLDGVELEIKQGFEYLIDDKNGEQINQITEALKSMDAEIKRLNQDIEKISAPDPEIDPELEQHLRTTPDTDANSNTSVNVNP